MPAPLRLASHSPAPTPLDHPAAVAAVLSAQVVVDETHRAMLVAGLGNLLPAVDAWRAAEAELELACVRERAVRFRGRGERWLEVVRG